MPSQDWAPVVPGLLSKQPLNEHAVGRVLFEELHCAACHDGGGEPINPVAMGPDLTETGARIDPEYLQSYLSEPRSVHPGTRMPSLLQAKSEESRREIAVALAHFLSSSSEADFKRAAVDEGLIDQGRDLFHSVGCVACHAPLENQPQGETARGLEHVPAKFGVAGLSEFLLNPLRLRPSGRMPDMGLSRDESRAIASYLLRSQELPASAPLVVDAGLVEEGREHFEALGCIACHQSSLPEASPQPPIALQDLSAGCLSDNPRAAPAFWLDSSQRRALQAWLRSPGADERAETRVAHILTSFNCIACHERDGYGGVAPALLSYFGTDEPDLGEQARIPPSLTLVGAKLSPPWLRKVIFDGRSVRPYMHTRMPRFGAANLASLPQLLEVADISQVAAQEMPGPADEDARRAAREAGRELLGTGGLACVSCHEFQGRPSANFAGIDLILASERLQPDWFAAFLVAPQRFSPGIVMPDSWPDGVAVHQGILDGDTSAQIQAIWYYLSLGTSARVPDGIDVPRSVLEVSDGPRTYRGRSGIAGFRGIAVGFPDGLNYAFDANNGSLSGIWRGGFVSVRWDGQGAGGFQPAARPIELPRDVSFVLLEEQESPWPLRPVVSDENPINPDPLYPRQLGYRFLGYSLGPDEVPTLRYGCGEVEIEDRTVPVQGTNSPGLQRTIQLRAPAAQTLYFRALAESYEVQGEREYRTPRLMLRVDAGTVLERDAELIVRLDLPEGLSTLTIDYELLP